MNPNEKSPLTAAYFDFLSRCKTEVEVCDFIHDEALKQGFADAASPHDGGRLKISLRLNKRCGILLSIGDFASIDKGLKLLATHVDSPRLDLKPAPAQEKFGVGTLQTRYYGGVKYYHWVGMPLELHGRGQRADGSTFSVRIGRGADEPVFTISDLAPHLGHQPEGGAKNSTAITAEHLNLISGLRGSDGETGRPAKVFEKLLQALDLKPEDFVTGEFEAVPAVAPRYIGFGGDLIGAYGHDNRSCTFAALQAMFAADDPNGNYGFVFTDREEVGSQGIHGADSNMLERFLFEVFEKFGDSNYFRLRRTISNTVMVSGDVNVACDPTWSGPTDENNSGHLGKGVCIAKYTGARGKRGASEADSSLVGQMRNIMIREGIAWQPGELGKVDFGGGGTVAMHFTRQGVQVFDMGPPVLGMHSPFEILSTEDLKTTRDAYAAFLKSFVIENPIA
ncbi:M20/M25/M40 family metallo-hydrolase [Martelella sp. HB161492]|uniref:M20/M25/M40 family metallo-hydrolase n=1 Tax=Martelella sp. HB161492 TaxID=2720726 RepID=UPI0015911BBF|nr:M20/M25/M40 family metallo-hydrolase [Martelella sp. HB161492]